MRVTATIAAIVLVLSTATPPQRVEAQVTFGAALSWGSETDLGLGGRLNFGLGELTRKSKIEGRVAFDYFFPNGFDYWQITADAFYQVATSGPAKPYLGGGLGYADGSADTGDPLVRRTRAGTGMAFNSARMLGAYGGDSHIFADLTGGLVFAAIGNIRPFAEADRKSVV